MRFSNQNRTGRIGLISLGLLAGAATAAPVSAQGKPDEGRALSSQPVVRTPAQAPARAPNIAPPDTPGDVAAAPKRGAGPNLPPGLHKGPREGNYFFIRQFDATIRPQTRTKPDIFGHLKNIPLNDSGETTLSISGLARIRILDQQPQSLFLPRPPPKQLNIQFREQLTADLALNTHLRVVGEMVWGQVTGHNFVTPAIGRQDNGPEIAQAFVEMHDRMVGGDVGVIVGRQKISLGANTILSLQLAQNIERTFDAVRAYYIRPKFRLDVVAARPTTTLQGSFNDATDPTVGIWGAYASVALPRSTGIALNLDASYFNYTDAESQILRQRSREKRDLYGARLWGAAGPFRLNWTLGVQTGTIADRKIRSWSLISNTRVPFDGPLAPTLIVQADVISGGSREAGVIRTNNPIYGAQRHATFGNYLGFTNIISTGAAASILPARALNVQLGARAFWRYSADDGYALPYATAATARRTDTRFIGVLPALSARWQVTNHLSLRAVTTRLFASGGYKDAGQRDLQTNVLIAHFMF